MHVVGLSYTLRQEEWGLKELLTFVLAMTFVLAIGFHFMVNDIGFIEHYRHVYIKRGRWLLGFTPMFISAGLGNRQPDQT